MFILHMVPIKCNMFLLVMKHCEHAFFWPALRIEINGKVGVECFAGHHKKLNNILGTVNMPSGWQSGLASVVAASQLQQSCNPVES